MRIFHMFHESFAAKNDFMTDGTRRGSGATYHERCVLLQNTKVQLKLLRGMRSQTALCGESLPTYVAMKRPVLGPFDLGVVVP